MITLTRQFTVAAPAGAVLEYLRDFGATTHWDPATLRTTRVGTGPIEPGARWRNESKVLGVTSELTYTLEAADGDRLVFTGRSEGATSTAVLTVRAVEQGTEVTYHVDLEVHGLAKLATPVLRLQVEKLSDEATERLTRILNQLVHSAFN